ncbi:hypothetical protein GCM10009688_06750 [Arthrobacter gandavensis]|uniref:Uncharacterized protein n=1 Tax=Arthrobacter gandavensis TaxID=169960 RepID=A0ABP5A6S6_9MICC
MVQEPFGGQRGKQAVRGGARERRGPGDVAGGYSVRHRGANGSEHSGEPMDNLRTLDSLNHVHIMNV